MMIFSLQLLLNELNVKNRGKMCYSKIIIIVICATTSSFRQYRRAIVMSSQIMHPYSHNIHLLASRQGTSDY